MAFAQAPTPPTPPGPSETPPPPPPPPPPPSSDPSPTQSPTSAPTPPSSAPSPTPTSDSNTNNDSTTPTPTPTSTSQTNDTSNVSPTPTQQETSGQNQQGETGINGNQQATDTQNNTASNTITGPGSTNEANTSNSNTSTVSNKNNATVVNNIDQYINSGWNTASYNTLPGGIQTGNAVAGLNLVTNVNSNITGIGGFETVNILGNVTNNIIFSFADNSLTGNFSNGTTGTSYNQAGSQIAENAITGPDSTNSSNNSSSNTNNTTNNNDATLVNNITINANTGNNSASFNTEGGNIQSGNANITANIINFSNTNLNVGKWLIGIVNIFGNFVGNIILPRDDSTNSSNNNQIATNTATGPDSTNSANNSSSDAHTFSNYNNAEVINNIDTSALTGGNSASYNTEGGEVKNGNANVAVSENTVANTNTQSEGTVWLVIVNKLGQWFGYIVGAPQGATTAASPGVSISSGNGGGNNSTPQSSGNTATGPNSTNLTNNTNTNTDTVTNKNDATIVNNIKLTANTGGNSSSYNTLGGDVESGDANVGLNIVNFINTNIVAKKFVVLLVNVFGNWLGNIIPPDQPLPQSPTPAPPQNQIGETNQEGETPPQGEDISTSVTPPSFQENQEGGKGGIGVGPTVVVNNTVVSSNSQQTVFTATSGVIERANTPQNTNSFGQIYTMEYFDYLGLPQNSFRRGLFVSPTFAKEAEPTVAGKLFGGKDIITSSWLAVLIPLMMLLVIIRRKFVFLNFKVYLTKILEVIL